MIIRICIFTEKGFRLADRIEEAFSEHIIERAEKDKIREFVREAFLMRAPLIFIGACGIAVRMIAEHVKDKLTDSPVLVLDEEGRFVIPLLSGHVGGGCVLATELADIIGAEAVITTATDVNQLFSVDVFAVDNYLRIYNRDGIKKVSSKLLKNGHITMSISPQIIYEPEKVPEYIDIVSYPPADMVDVCISENTGMSDFSRLLLVPKTYVIGIGCKKGKKSEDIRKTAETAINGFGSFDDIAYAATIDLKSKEYGLVKLCMENGIKLKAFSAEELKRLQGEFSESEFVMDITGVSNVCERACMMDADELVVRKTAENGVTAALARRKARIEIWKN